MAQINQDLLLLQLRATAFGIGYSDLLAANRSARDWASWSEKIAEFADRYEGLAESADAHPKSAEQWWQTIANYYHFAQMFLQGEQKATYQTKSRTAYNHFAALTTPTPQRIAIPYRETLLPGFIQISHPDAPIVILRGGLEFAKEVEMHQLGQPFVARGMSVLCFDGLGEGELMPNSATAEDFTPMIQTVIDFLYEWGYATAATLIGIFGVSSGGYLAMWAAAMDDRVAACISIGGFFDGSSFFNLAPRNKQMAATLFGIENVESLTDSADYFPPLSTLSRALTCPLLLVHGSNDHIVPIEQVQLLQSWAQGETQTWLLEYAGHVCYERFGDLLPVVADWMAAQLGVGLPVDAALFQA